MKAYYKFLITVVILLSGIAFLPYAASSFYEDFTWQNYAGAYRTRNSSENLGWLSTVPISSSTAAMKGSILYNGFTTLGVVDAANPSSMRVLNKFTTDYIYELAVKGQYVITAQQDFGIRVFDVTVNLPTFFSGRRMKGGAFGLALDGDTLLVANGASGVYLIDATKMADLPVLSLTKTPDIAYGVYASGNTAYIADGAAGLRIWDISDRAHPVETGSLDTPGSARRVTVRGDFAFVSDGVGGVRMINVADKTHPREVGVYYANGFVSRVALAGDDAFIAVRDHGVLVLDVSDPSSPVYNGFYESPGGAWDLVVNDGTVYLSDSPWGLLAIGYHRPYRVDLPASGGSLVSPSDGVRLEFEPGSFSGEVRFTYLPAFAGSTPISTVYYPKIGPLFKLSAVDRLGNPEALLIPVKVTVPFNAGSLTDAQKKNLGLYYWSSAGWVKEPSSTVNLTDGTVSAQLEKLAIWAVLQDRSK